MSTMKYTIWTRYEAWTKEGKQFTKWFMSCRSNNFFDSENDAIEEMKIQKSSTNITDKIVKLKREYEIRYIDIDELPKPKPKRPRGRPKKNAEA